MSIIDSKELVNKIEEEIKQFSKSCIIRPSVALIDIGNDPINQKCVKAMEDACNRVGIYFRYHNYEDNTPELTVINKIKELDNDDYVNGIMINLPMPEKYNEKRLLNTIINSKDIDGLTDINIGRLNSGRKTIVPCCPQGIMELLKYNNIEVTGKEITIVGDNKLVYKPLISLLLNEGATVTICNSNTSDISMHTLTSDIVISCMNKKNSITSDMIKEDSIVIDVGRSIDNDKIVGDVESKVSKKATLIPLSDIGNITTAMFLKNTIFCYNNKK